MGRFGTKLTPDGPRRLILSLIGDLDTATAAQGDTAILPLLTADRLSVLDGVQLRSLDAAGLRELNAVAERARATGAETRLVATRPAVLSALESGVPTERLREDDAIEETRGRPPIMTYPSVKAALAG